MAIAAVMLGGMGTVMAGSLAMQGYQMSQGAPKIPDVKFPSFKNPEDEGEAAIKKRRSMYAGMGRSSTILTGPGGIKDSPNLAAGDPSMPKQLLGL